MQVKRRRILAAIGSGAALALVITGCAGSGTSGDSSSGSKTLIVGVSSPLTGVLATAGEAQACGVQIYFNAANSAGGINGYQVKTDVQDNQYESQASATVARKMVDEGAVAIFAAGPVPLQASEPATKPAGTLLFGTVDGVFVTPPTQPGEFSIYPRYQDDLATSVNFIVNDLGKKKVSLVNAVGTGQASSDAWPGILSAAGAQEGAHVEINPAQSDFPGYAQRLKEGGADVVVVQWVGTALAQLQQESANIGYDPKWLVVPWGYGPAYLKQAGALAEGTYVTQWEWPSIATDQPSVQKYDADAKAMGGRCGDLVDDPNTLIGYNNAAVAGYAMSEATKDGSAPTLDAMSKALNFEGKAIGTVDSLGFSSDSGAGASSASYWQVQNGNLVQVGKWRPILKTS